MFFILYYLFTLFLLFLDQIPALFYIYTAGNSGRDILLPYGAQKPGGSASEPHVTFSDVRESLQDSKDIPKSLVALLNSLRSDLTGGSVALPATGCSRGTPSTLPPPSRREGPGEALWVGELVSASGRWRHTPLPLLRPPPPPTMRQWSARFPALSADRRFRPYLSYFCLIPPLATM